ncbi:MAG: PQQ-binding-like beta-propeller repeat protein [Anaerolineae bacterium]|nr:PQQ-binding-like beta-propeller repeat protein [Anaerolineae bacterium]
MPKNLYCKERLLNNSLAMVSSLILFAYLSGLITGCFPNQMVNEPVPTRSILENNLPIDLRWLARANIANSRTPMTCFEDHGAIAGTLTEEDVQLKGTIFFNDEGKVLWHQPQGLPSAVALDDKQVYVFNRSGTYSSRPSILVYDTHTGEELWQTSEEIADRQGSAYLEVQGDELTYFTARQVNTYATDDGEMIAGESIPTGNIVMRQSGIDLYNGNGFYLYATISGEPEAYLWTADYNINGRPHVFEENIIVKRRRSVVCSVELASGQTTWCSDKHLYNSRTFALAHK